MIRLFTALCKSILENLSTQNSFQEATDSYSHYNEKCPNCGAFGKLYPHGSYTRNLVYSINEEVAELRISPLRFKCASCGTTHALLPDILVPYSPYSLQFQLTVLIAYFERITTVEAVCIRFGIAISTLYAWKKCLMEHKELLVGLLKSKQESALEFLRNLFTSANISVRLQSFFQQYSFSFLQSSSHKNDAFPAAIIYYPPLLPAIP